MKRITFILAIYLISGNLTTAQISFHNGANMNIPRGLISCTTDGANIYVNGGFTFTAGYTTEIEKYNISTDSWTVFANSLIPKRYTASKVIGNKLYIFNGYSSTSYNAKMEVVDLTTGSITYSTDNPNPVEQSGSAVWNNKIYVFGGSQGIVNSNKLYVFDPATEVWTELASMPEGKQTKGEIVNGKLYVIGGYNGSASTRIDMYDIQTNTWTFIMNMPQGVSAHATTYWDNKIWIVGDYTTLTYLAYYDVVKNEFATVQSNMIGRRHAGTMAVNGKLYVMGGNQNSYSNSALSSLQVSDGLLSGLSNNMVDNFKIYMNQSNSILNIAGLTQTSDVTLSDLSGKVFIHEQIRDNQIDVKKLPVGIFLIQIQNKSGIITKKFIK
ncbi:MAG TPA: kelch repeat-containing protein [Paludibacter sp.]